MTDTSTPWTRRRALAAGAAAMMAGVARAEELPWKMPDVRGVRVHDQHIAYYEAGSGPPLVLVHGASGSPPLEFGRVLAPLAKRFRVLVPYLIGYAPSAQPDLPYDAATFVRYLGGFLEARGADGATLAGESLGGWVVGHYAVSRQLPRISRLIVLDGALQITPGLRGGGAEKSINDPEIAKAAHEYYVSQPKVDNSRVASVVGAHVVQEQVTDAQLQRLKVPTLVVWGREDQLTPVAIGEHIGRQVPGARTVIIDGCGHIPSVEQPRALLRAVGDFLKVPGLAK